MHQHAGEVTCKARMQSFAVGRPTTYLSPIKYAAGTGDWLDSAFLCLIAFSWRASQNVVHR